MPYNDNEERDEIIGKVKLGVGIGAGVLAAVLLVATIWQSFTVIESGYVGVVTTFGKVEPKPLQPGLRFLIPWVQGCVHQDTRLKKFEVEKSNAASHDLQTVFTQVAVQHALNGDLAPEAYQSIGGVEAFDQTVIEPAVLEAIKAVTAQYTAEELVTQREVVKQKIVELIQRNIDTTLESKGLKGALQIANVTVKEFEFSKEFSESIEAKVRVAQDALRAQNEKEKRITNAQATKRERELAADAEAFKITQESTARAAAIEREAKALEQNPQLIDLRMIERWNGQLPTFSSGQAFPLNPSPTPSADKTGK